MTPFILRRVFKTVAPEDLLHLQGQDLYFGEVKIDESQRKALREQAEAFQGGFLYKVLSKAVYHDVCKRLINDADTLPAKMEFIALQTIEEVINECRQL